MYHWQPWPTLAESIADHLGLHGFDDQAAAEAWLTSNYVLLTDAGVQTVTLYDDDRLVYGPMSLLE